jgi:hypothetical protein
MSFQRLTAERLRALAARTGRATTFYVREAVEAHLDDLEDLYLAERASTASIATRAAPGLSKRRSGSLACMIEIEDQVHKAIKQKLVVGLCAPGTDAHALPKDYRVFPSCDLCQDAVLKPNLLSDLRTRFDLQQLRTTVARSSDRPAGALDLQEATAVNLRRRSVGQAFSLADEIEEAMWVGRWSGNLPTAFSMMKSRQRSSEPRELPSPPGPAKPSSTPAACWRRRYPRHRPRLHRITRRRPPDRPQRPLRPARPHRLPVSYALAATPVRGR